MDQFKLLCSKCGAELLIPVYQVGQRKECASCGQTFTVPKVGAPMPQLIATQEPAKKSQRWVWIVMIFVGALVGFSLSLPSPAPPPPVNATIPPMPPRIQERSTAPSFQPGAVPSQTKTVYIAPQQDKLFHLQSNCEGLRDAKSVEPVSEITAISKGYGHCPKCFP